MRRLIFSDYQEHTSPIFKSLKVPKLQDIIQFNISKLIYFTLMINCHSKSKIFLFKTNQCTHITVEMISCSSYLTLIQPILVQNH